MNKVILIGRLTRDPEIRYTQTNPPVAIARYTVAVDRPTRDGDQAADFVPCVAFSKTAEFAEKHLVKGSKIAAEGRIQTGSYTDKNGKTHYTVDVVVERTEFCESKKTLSGRPAQPGFIDVPDGIDDEIPFA